jgi:L-proline amide hydrolase
MAPKIREGQVPFQGHRTWYRIVGENEVGHHPLLVLHGGPGAAHDYLEPLEDLASTGRQVIFYDQLGCGRSDHIHDPDLWTVQLFLDELRTVRGWLGLDRLHLLGHSWGGMLAMEHALTRSEGIESLIICNSPADMGQWVSEAGRLREELPRDVQLTLLRHEAAGTTMSPEYQAAMLEFYRRHVCRLDPWPDYIDRSFAQLARDPEVYNVMCGPSEFFVTGKLRDWSVVHRLGEIREPTLLLSGRYDEATPEIVGTIQRGIAGSEWRLFEQSSHMPHAEERKLFMTVLSEFLDGIEQGSPNLRASYISAGYPSRRRAHRPG